MRLFLLREDASNRQTIDPPRDRMPALIGAPAFRRLVPWLVPMIQYTIQSVVSIWLVSVGDRPEGPIRIRPLLVVVVDFVVAVVVWYVAVIVVLVVVVVGDLSRIRRVRRYDSFPKSLACRSSCCCCRHSQFYSSVVLLSEDRRLVRKDW